MRHLRKLTAAARGLDPGRVMLRNPFFSAVRMKLGTALLILPAHERRHLWQAGNVRAVLVSGGEMAV
jgi:hypothetical protein